MRPSAKVLPQPLAWRLLDNHSRSQSYRMTKRFSVYIDGFNLYKGTLEKRPEVKWLDLTSYAGSLNPSGQLIKVYYFTARVKSRFQEDKAPNRQHSYLRALENSGVEVVQGKFHKSEKWKRLVSPDRERLIDPNFHPLWGLTQKLINQSWSKSHPDVPKAQVFQFEEKGSDVNLASYLLRDVYSGSIDEAFVVTGDSDLVSPIKFANQAGIPTHVRVPGTGQNMNDLRSAGCSLKPVDVNDLKNHQFPKNIVTPRGGHIKIPDSWS